jgi:hypothetical protein
VAQSRAATLDCILGTHFAMTEVFISVDGEVITIGEPHSTVFAPFVPEEWAYPALPGLDEPALLIGAAYLVMLEPLDPGSHTIEWGYTLDAHSGSPDIERSIINAEVVEASDGHEPVMVWAGQRTDAC